MRDLIHWARLHKRCYTYQILLWAVMIVMSVSMLLTSGTTWLVAQTIWTVALGILISIQLIQQYALRKVTGYITEIIRKRQEGDE